MTAPNLPKSTGKKNLKASLDDYGRALRHLERLEIFGIKLGLDNIRELCRILGNPQLAFRAVHVAGTNGKGSVAAMCSSILREAGLKTGMYTSPHLQTIRERIQTDGRMISREEFAEAFLKAREASSELEKKGTPATHFEFMTAMAFLHFREKGCEFAVIETGMGGRLDATNVLSPEVAVITGIGIDHARHLGSTKSRIAEEKAGIIKENCSVVIGEKDERIKRQILETCRSRSAVPVEPEDPYRGRVPLPGEHQRRNASVAAAAVRSLGAGISAGCVERGIAKTRWPGRLETLQKNPLVILDSSHNPEGMAATSEYVRSLGREFVLVLGISEDKDVDGIAGAIAPLAAKVIATSSEYRGFSCRRLLEAVRRYNENCEAVDGVKAAVEKAMETAGSRMVLVTGSVFVAGEARSVWFESGD